MTFPHNVHKVNGRLSETVCSTEKPVAVVITEEISINNKVIGDNIQLICYEYCFMSFLVISENKEL